MRTKLLAVAAMALGIASLSAPSASAEDALVKYPGHFPSLQACQNEGRELVRRTWASRYECHYDGPWFLYYEPR
ncbi:hypothetical protein [Allokutzneria sp. NRRL B-24872]|uniref:hypothetical protein n=1 Tax=Allokutzneria sp. NRRL B-24872 TaxID=1137961 RepID=UPI0011785A74|nr:hypothetical protein [Allokutzneria sp. NRRL B-24872]